MYRGIIFAQRHQKSGAVETEPIRCFDENINTYFYFMFGTQSPFRLTTSRERSRKTESLAASKQNIPWPTGSQALYFSGPLFNQPDTP